MEAKRAPRRIELRAIDLEDLGLDVVFINSQDGERKEKAKEQARLIAAAPDLLAALEQVIRPYGMYDIAASHANGPMQDELLAIGKQIRAAIAKAVG